MNKVLVSLVVLAVVVAGPCPVEAGHFDWDKTVSITPHGGGAAVAVRGVHYNHVWAKNDNGARASDAEPNVQPPGFHAFGRDSMTSNHSVDNWDTSIPGVTVNMSTQGLGIGDFFLGRLVTASVNGPYAYGESISSSSWESVGPGGKVTAKYGATGNTTATAAGRAGSAAYAFAFSGVQVAGNADLKKGQIDWNVVAGHAGATSMSTRPGYRGDRDPIWFSVRDTDSGELLLEETVYDNWFIDYDGDASYTWDEGGFAVNATNAEFHIVQTSPYILEHGTVDLVIVDGVITVSSATGIYAGLLPGVGGGGSFVAPLSASGTLTYDLGEFSGHSNLSITANMDLSDETLDAVPGVPEPSSLLGLAAGLFALAGLARHRRAH